MSGCDLQNKGMVHYVKQLSSIYLEYTDVNKKKRYLMAVAYIRHRRMPLQPHEATPPLLSGAIILQLLLLWANLLTRNTVAT
ncbi:hypothetical protein INR49_027591 [Caranx melampygus]|nr:hypothetical protein INR49_027591 [Caranx melampygus]